MAQFYKSLKEGQSCEDEFKNLVELHGATVDKSSFKDNTRRHIDFYVSDFYGSNFSVDVKAQKRASRSDSNFDSKYTWIELKNVRGDKGWLYGDADKIAFQMSDCFVLVDRLDLVKFCEDNIDTSCVVDSAKSAIYKIYTRKGRKDCISRIETSMIKTLASCTKIEYIKG